MATNNKPAPQSDADVVKSIAFPFRRGANGFPAIAEEDRVVHYSLMALVLTGKNERVMLPALGVNGNSYVFETITPLMKARLASEIRKAVAEYEPRAEIVRILPEEAPSREDPEQTTLNVTIEYRIAGQVKSQQIPLGPVQQQNPTTL